MNLYAIKSISSDGSRFDGYASIFGNLDQANDVIIKGAFRKSIEKHYQGSTVKLLWQHDRAKPIGVINKILEDNKGLFVDVTLNTASGQGQEAASLVKQGAVDSFSIGFNILQYTVNKSGQREITEIDLWEVSLVTFPANHHAKIRNIHAREFSREFTDSRFEELSSFLSVKSTTIFR